jgi:hypothetical protein
MENSNTHWLEDIKPEQGWYLAGFADGEGSFNVSLRRRADHTMGWQVVLTFNVSQKEEYILAMFKKTLGCGRLQARPDGIYYYVVSNPRSITERVIPFFNRFTFWSQRKKRNFAIFTKIAELVMAQRHLTSEGLEEIIQLREQLNEGRGRKRKYTIRDYHESQRGNPQRLYAKPRQFREETGGDDIVRSHGRP